MTDEERVAADIALKLNPLQVGDRVETIQGETGTVRYITTNALVCDVQLDDGTQALLYHRALRRIP